MTSPNEYRWDGWVTIAWLIAFLTCAVSVWLVFEFGFVEVTRPSMYGSLPAVKETIPNMPVIGLAIGQSIGALLLAALFSIANGAYRNSCQTVRLLTKLHAAQAQPDAGDAESGSADPTSGLLVESVRDVSPLAGILRPGYRLLRINGHEPESVKDAASKVVEGKNQIVYCDLEGKVVSGSLTMTPGLLHITFADR